MSRGASVNTQYPLKEYTRLASHTLTQVRNHVNTMPRREAEITCVSITLEKMD